MKKYTTIKQTTLTAGVLKLTNDQYRRRSHLLEQVKDDNGDDIKGTYKIIHPCNFKVGESFSYSGVDMTPALAQCFDGAEDELKRKRAKEKQENNKPEAVGFFAALFKKKSDDELTDDEKEFVILVNAIDGIDIHNAELWTKQHGPKLAVLRDAVGNEELTEEQRDAAWDAWQARSEAGA